jgi:mannose-6-phosphate isomerase-like protein (cupin superfamily)
MPVIRLKDVPEVAVGGDANPLVMQKAVGSRSRDPKFVMPVSTDSLSITYIRHWSRHPRMTCNESDRVMFVVEGETTVQIGDEPPEVLKAGDFALIPKGTPYEFSGEFTYLVINAPAYREGSDIRDDSYDGPPSRRRSSPRPPSGRPRRR